MTDPSSTKPYSDDPDAEPPEDLVPGVRVDRSIGQVDDRDWNHQLFGGTRYWHEGTLELPNEPTGKESGSREGGTEHV